ncbi:hypothetical protein [Marinivivus vitaminiproducens]|uniref:hypothetical protein n=1 Tax=Marinivivus vitaminiproducens TaxID=3035935 RepID=UPI00279E864A|nr:hypothetical protein P4R82_17705 [Geminicoccaceae bacterium SCSIO 64248]
MDLTTVLRTPESPAGLSGLRARVKDLEADLDAQGSVVTAALLTATAFRMRDEAGLVTALRELVGAVSTWERSQAADG